MLEELVAAQVPQPSEEPVVQEESEVPVACPFQAVKSVGWESLQWELEVIEVQHLQGGAATSWLDHHQV